MSLEVLDGAFVLFGGFSRSKSAEILAMAGLRVRFPRVQSVFTVGELANHAAIASKKLAKLVLEESSSRMSDVPCSWAPIEDKLYRRYHDEEWGVPLRNSRALWEKFQLDGFQAGLSWITVLRKRAAMRKEFDRFDPSKIARYDAKRIARGLRNPDIIRSPTKIKAMIGNARIYLEMQERGEEFSEYLWAFVDNEPIVTGLSSWRKVQAKTALSERISKDMKQRGFKFCGPTIVYACMQAVGLVNDHETRCPRFREIQRMR